MASVISKHDTDSLPVAQQSNAFKSAEFIGSGDLVVTRLSAGEEQGVLSRLSAKSLTNVIMSGLILDNGLASPLNRGHFYACRSKLGELKGIALIGHTVLFDAFTPDAIQAFATRARAESSLNLLMGESESVRQFWDHYAEPERSPRHICPIRFLRASGPFPHVEPRPELRLATSEDLESLVLAHAEMSLKTSGANPSKKDPVGFRERYLRRIAHKRVWVLIRKGKLIFKTDVIAETPEATYIEGVYVDAEHRGMGLGSRCISELGRILLRRTKSIYLFAENQNMRTPNFYLKLGFNIAGQYHLLYF
jgi:ribosomal protein S18 acetylase RimI-like enzyme